MKDKYFYVGVILGISSRYLCVLYCQEGVLHCVWVPRVELGVVGDSVSMVDVSRNEMCIGVLRDV